MLGGRRLQSWYIHVLLRLLTSTCVENSFSLWGTAVYLIFSVSIFSIDMENSFTPARGREGGREGHDAQAQQQRCKLMPRRSPPHLMYAGERRGRGREIPLILSGLFSMWELEDFQNDFFVAHFPSSHPSSPRTKLHRNSAPSLRAPECTVQDVPEKKRT